MRRRCAENVDVLAAIDCSSPMSAKTRVKRPMRVPRRAGICMPQYVMATNRPTIFSATVLPPMFGPLITISRVRRRRAERLRHRALAEQRMAAVARSRSSASSTQLGRDRIHRAARRAALRDEQVELRRASRRSPRSAAASAPTCARELVQNARDLALFFDPQRAHAVVRLERRERLDEERLPARARVVHDAREPRRELGLDRHDEAPVANRDDGVLNRVRILRRAQQARSRGRALRSARAQDSGGCAPSAGEARSSTVPRFVDRVDERSRAHLGSGGTARVMLDRTASDARASRCTPRPPPRARRRSRAVRSPPSVARCCALRAVCSLDRRQHVRSPRSRQASAMRAVRCLFAPHALEIDERLQSPAQTRARAASAWPDDALPHARKVERFEVRSCSSDVGWWYVMVTV